VGDVHKERFTVAEAAKRMGVTTEAIRQRIRRGTIEYDQTEDGRYYVYASPTQGVPNNLENDYTNALKSQIELLERELEDRKEEARRKDTLLAQMTQTLNQMAQRIPELEPPREPRESDLSAGEERGGGDAPPDQEKRVSLWRRLFGK
jgi:predicted ArsR family transcriptional regulator